MYGFCSLVPSPSHPSFYLAVVEKKGFHGCEIKAGVGRTGNEAMNYTISHGGPPIISLVDK